MESFRIHTIEREHRDLDGMPIVVMQHFDEHHTDQPPIRNQIQAHYIPRNVFLKRAKLFIKSEIG